MDEVDSHVLFHQAVVMSTSVWVCVTIDSEIQQQHPSSQVKQAELENPTTGNGRPSATSTFSNHRTDPNAILLRGDEELPPDSELSTNAWYHVMETVESNVLEHVQKHENQLRSKMFIVVEPSPEQRDLLEVLKKLYGGAS